MRKWMRDRLKRRKKETDSGPTEAAPAPLQPAFYDDAPLRPEAEAPAPSPPSQPKAEPSEAAKEDTPSAQPQAEGTGDARRRRRRRSRGGRGRSRGTLRPPQGAEAAAKVHEPQEAAPPVPVAAPESAPETSAPVAHAAPVRSPKGTVVLAIGLPGSGKSAWFKRHNITPLSSDLVRALLFDDATEQRFQDLVFSNLRSMLKARLIARRPMNYVDATNLTPHDRHGWIKLAKDYGSQAVFFDVPVEVCLQRNARRQRVVPEDVMRRMAGKLKPPAFEEGFSKITVVRVKHSESAAS
jgi:predicted kinase